MAGMLKILEVEYFSSGGVVGGGKEGSAEGTKVTLSKSTMSGAGRI